jgi:probable F420-dependent oxidoreductase
MDTSGFRVGVQLRPQHTTMARMRDAWQRIEELEVAGRQVTSLWTWDHFFPLSGDPSGAHFEGWTTVAAMAATTGRASVGLLVTGNGYRYPDLLADMARTLDHVSGGRAVLGLGAGWFERDYDEYGYDFGTAPDRLRLLADALPRIERRLAALTPPPLQSPLPLMIGGSGERVTLRLVARHATMWNGLGSPEVYRHKNGVLDDWCERLGRDPAAIERTAWFDPAEHPPSIALDYVAAGATHVIVGLAAPFDDSVVRELLSLAGGH